MITFSSYNQPQEHGRKPHMISRKSKDCGCQFLGYATPLRSGGWEMSLEGHLVYRRTLKELRTYAKNFYLRKNGKENLNGNLVLVLG
jgi:hypothetical protein